MKCFDKYGFAALVVAMLSSTQCGCLVKTDQYDVPTGVRDADPAYQFKLLDLRDGITHRKDVERVLGSPESTKNEEEAVAYRWQKVRYEKHVLVPKFIPVPHGKSEDDVIDLDPHNRAAKPVATRVIYSSLLLKYDEDGLLERHEKIRNKIEYGGPPVLSDLLAQWVEKYPTTR